MRVSATEHMLAVPVACSSVTTPRSGMNGWMDGLNLQPKQDAVAPRWRARPSDPDPPQRSPACLSALPTSTSTPQTADRNRQLQQPPWKTKPHSNQSQPGAALHCTARAPVAGSARITIDVSCRVVSCWSLASFSLSRRCVDGLDGWMDGCCAAWAASAPDQIKSIQTAPHRAAPYRTASAFWPGTR
jgi:hypothetical protein